MIFRLILLIFFMMVPPALAAIDHKDLPAPKPTLSTWDVSTYSKIFEKQELAAWDEADAAIKKLSNGLLMGHVLAHRYLHPKYKASFDELKNWMAYYADHPQSGRLYDLALARRPEGNNDKVIEPDRDVVSAGILGLQGTQARIYQSKKKRGDALQKDIDTLIRQIRGAVDRYEPSRAMSLLNSKAGKSLDDTEYDQARALISAGYLYAQKPDSALKIAQSARKRSGTHVPLAYWVEGLVHWQRRDYGKAGFAFEKAAASPYASGWLQAAASYWAARSYMRGGDVKNITPWLRVAAKNPRTFYGLLATRALGQDFRFLWDMPIVTPRHIQLLEKYKQGQRAKALIDVEQYTLAEEDLKTIPGIKEDADIQEALLAYASNKNLAGLQLYLGNTVPRPDKTGLYDGALFPLLPWEPKGGYQDDKALMHALIRQESRFRVSVVSDSGAIGLMQLMPPTAAFITKDKTYEDVAGQAALKKPVTNLDIGQQYMHHLLDLKAVDMNMLYLALAYNAGPGKLSQWKKERANLEDPLMFIETIPFAETRDFVERVMANYWIYQMRLGEPTPTLDRLAEGGWPFYENTGPE